MALSEYVAAFLSTLILKDSSCRGGSDCGCLAEFMCLWADVLMTAQYSMSQNGE